MDVICGCELRANVTADGRLAVKRSKLRRRRRKPPLPLLDVAFELEDS